MSDRSLIARRFVAGGLAFAAGASLAWLMPRPQPVTARDAVTTKPIINVPSQRGPEIMPPEGAVAPGEIDPGRLAIDYAAIDPLRAAAFAQEALSPSLRQEALEGIAVVWARTDPTAAATWARSVNERALHLILYPWFDQEPDVVCAWVRTADTPGERDALWVQLARWQMEKNPAGAGAFIAEISDDARRARTALTLVRRWARDDFDLAGEWALRAAAPELRHALVDELAQIAVAQTAVSPR